MSLQCLREKEKETGKLGGTREKPAEEGGGRKHDFNHMEMALTAGRSGRARRGQLQPRGKGLKCKAKRPRARSRGFVRAYAEQGSRSW